MYRAYVSATRGVPLGGTHKMLGNNRRSLSVLVDRITSMEQFRIWKRIPVIGEPTDPGWLRICEIAYWKPHNVIIARWYCLVLVTCCRANWIESVWRNFTFNRLSRLLWNAFMALGSKTKNRVQFDKFHVVSTQIKLAVDIFVCGTNFSKRRARVIFFFVINKQEVYTFVRVPLETLHFCHVKKDFSFVKL